MKYHCDALLPQQERYASFKYRRLSRWFDPYKQDKTHLLELTIFCLTPGITLPHIGFMMQWDPSMHAQVRDLIIPHYETEAQHYVPDNAASITEIDGMRMIQAILDGNPARAGKMPLQVTRYLQARRARGATSKTLAAEFNTTPGRIKGWWSADLFDPLSGALRPKGTTIRNKPIRYRRGVTV